MRTKLVNKNLTQDGKPIANYCLEKGLTSSAIKIATFLQKYYGELKGTINFSELFPLIKNSDDLNNENALLEKIVQKLHDHCELSFPIHYEFLCRYYENWLLEKLKISTLITRENISTIAQKMAQDLQLYYKVAPAVTAIVFTPDYITDQLLRYPSLLLDKTRNCILLLPITMSYEAAASNIVKLLKGNFSYEDAKPFLENYCDHIRKKLTELNDLCPSIIMQLRVNMSFLIYHFYRQIPEAIDQFYDFLSNYILPNIKLLAISNQNEIIEKWINPEVALYKKEMGLVERSTASYLERDKLPLVKKSLDSKMMIWTQSYALPDTLPQDTTTESPTKSSGYHLRFHRTLPSYLRNSKKNKPSSNLRHLK